MNRLEESKEGLRMNRLEESKEGLCMNRLEEFEEARPLLYALARRMLGSASEAEDAVHEAWLRYEATDERPASGREFLTAEVVRTGLRALRTRRLTRQTHLGPLPGDLVQDSGWDLVQDSGWDLGQDIDQGMEPTQALLTAALLLLERLSPLERAVFVLREVFGCDIAEIASALGCSQEACRQLAAAVSRTGDGDGTAPPWPQRIAGADHVARVFAAIVPALARIGVTMEPQQVGHHPGAVFRDRNGRLLSALALGIRGGRIHTLRWVVDPHRLVRA